MNKNSILQPFMLAVALSGAWAFQLSAAEVRVYETTPWGALSRLESGSDIAFGSVDIKSKSEKTYYISLTEAVVNDVTLSSTEPDMFNMRVSSAPSALVDDAGNQCYELTVAATAGETVGQKTAVLSVTVTGQETPVTLNASMNVMNLSASTISGFIETAVSAGWSAVTSYTGKAEIRAVHYHLMPDGSKSGMQVFVHDDTGDLAIDLPGYDREVQPGRALSFRGHTTSKKAEGATWVGVDYSLNDVTEWVYPSVESIETAPSMADVGKVVSLKGCVYKSQTSQANPGQSSFFITFTKGGKDVKCKIPDSSNRYINGLGEAYKSGDVEIIGAVISDAVDFMTGPEPFIIPTYIRGAAPETPLAEGEWSLEAYNVRRESNDQWKATVNSTEDPFVYQVENLIDGKDGKITLYVAPDGKSVDIITGEQFKYSESFLQAWESDGEDSFAVLGRGATVSMPLDDDGIIQCPLRIGYVYANDGNPIDYIWEGLKGKKYVQPSFEIQVRQPWGYESVADGSVLKLRRTSVERSYTDDTYLIKLGDNLSPSDLTFTVETPDVFEAGIIGNEQSGYNLHLALKPQREANTYTSALTISDPSGLSQTFSITCEVRDLRCADIKAFKELASTMSLNDELIYTGQAHVNHKDGNTLYLSDASGNMILQCLTGATDGIEQGMIVSFTGTCSYQGDTEYPNWKGISVEHRLDIFPNWDYPERKTIDHELTSEDYGKYVSIKNVSFKSFSEDILSGMFAREDGTNLLWYEFEDENGVVYNVHPEGGAQNRYGFGIPKEFENKDVKLEIVGVVFGGSRYNGYPTPYINPQYIRLMEPANPLPEGEYTMNAYSIMWDTQEKPWIVTVTRDEENRYLYSLQDLVYGNGHSPSADTHCTVKAELDDTCTELHIISGQQFDEIFSNAEVEYYLAFADSFDRSGHTPEQEPLAKGTEAVCTREGNTLTIPLLISYTCYGNIWRDPEHEYWANRWSHFGLWKDGATLAYVTPYPVPENLKAEINDRTVILSWDPCVSDEYQLSGYRVYYNGTPLVDLDRNTVSYTISNVRDNSIDFCVSSLWGDDNEESRQSEVVTVEIDNGINDLSGVSSTVLPVEGGILITNPVETRVAVYNLSGSCVWSSDVIGSRKVAVEAGVYLVRINGRSYKLYVR